MRDVSELNINEGGGPVLRPPPSDELIASFEAETGLPMPMELRSFLRLVNGGHPERDSVGGNGGQFAVGRFYHLSAENYGPESLWYAAKHWRPVLGDKAIPFATDGGGNQFFLDLSETPSSVKLCLHDESMRIIAIAPTFETFIDELDADQDMI